MNKRVQLSVKWLQFVLTLLAIGLLAWELHVCMPALIQWVQNLGIYTWIGFFLLYCVAVLLFLPIEPVVFASGAMFEFYYGFLITLFCAVVSSSIAFMISRYFGFSWLPNRKNQLLTKWLEQVDSYGWKALAVSRLTPLPCAVVNYGYGLTSMRLSVYTLTNLIFFIPYKLIMTYVGSHL